MADEYNDAMKRFLGRVTTRREVEESGSHIAAPASRLVFSIQSVSIGGHVIFLGEPTPAMIDQVLNKRPERTTGN